MATPGDGSAPETGSPVSYSPLEYLRRLLISRLCRTGAAG